MATVESTPRLSIARQRLVHQHLVTSSLAPLKLVAAFGAIQAQEYEQAKWALGVRTEGTTERDIERLLADGKILRTHPMRGTHHFVARDDMRWLLGLMGPLMIRRNARRNRELDLDEKTLTRAVTVIARAVEDGTHLQRSEVAELLRRSRIAPDGQRLSHIIYRAELEAVVCSGRRAGKQITIASFDERVGPAKPRSRDDSLRELARRYFATRGPATGRDFAWWCQLPAADVRAAIELAKLVEHDGYYGARSASRATLPAALLLPAYDEYTVAYADRSAVGSPPKQARTFGESALLGPNLVISGAVVASWRRTIRNKTVCVALTEWRPLTTRERTAAKAAVARYAAFYGYLPQLL